MSKTIREALDNYCEQLTGQRPETRTILDSLNAITEANGGTPSQGGLVDAIDCFCACSGGQSVVLGDIPAKMETTAEGFAAYVTELVIPEGVTSFNLSKNGADGDIYFHEFENLKKLTLPASMTTLNYHCLGYPEGAGVELFSRLEEIVVSEGTTTITECAFEHCGRSGITVYLPSTIETIHEDAFGCCNNNENDNVTIVINKPEGSVSGAPWTNYGHTTVIWRG